ncbi:MAG: formate dehydrogenase subunit alpha [Gammaproteobacteria bacterium]|nr:formate dehydrogenase subunit alpha [Gammaproteobacteria bacterium]
MAEETLDLTCSINGAAVVINSGDTILSAARRASLADPIPTLCYREGSSPDGGCALCLVKVSNDKDPDTTGRLVSACHTAVQPGDRVTTRTPDIVRNRREILSLMLNELPAGVASRTRGGGRRGGDFWQLVDEYGARAGKDTNTVATGKQQPIERSHPYLRFDPELCVTCRRCVHTCEDLQGQFVFGIGNRGADVQLLIGSNDRFADSDCVACGACVDECPTGALFDRDREPDLSSRRSSAGSSNRPLTSLTSVRTTCGYCGVGCGIHVVTDGMRVVRIDGAEASPVNHGHLCAKGRYAHGFQASPERLTTPLLRQNDELVEVSWETALAWLAEKLTTIRAESGAESLGAMTSSRSTNEANYLLQKLFRTCLGSNNVDNCARVCHASTALALRTVTGTGAASASFADIESAQCIVVAGANPTEAHPIVGARIKQAVRRGARLIVIDPRRIELTEWADLHLALKPGTNVALFNALAKVLIEAGLIDHDYIDSRLEGFAALQAFLAGDLLNEAAEVCGVDVRDIKAAAALIGEAAPVLFVHGLGLSELTQGTASVMTLCNLGMLTGSIGKPGGGMLPLRGQNNVQGNADMGALPNLFTGYQPINDPKVREHVNSIWGILPPEAPGLTIPEMIDAAAEGRIRGLWIQGEDVAQSDPNQTHVLGALEKLDLLVVQELFMTGTAERAHLVLPAAASLEQEGTFTNGERRIQRVRQSLPPPGEARPDWLVVRDVANCLGAGWDYPDPAAVMDEIARVAPHLFGGVSYARLGDDGLQWPCPSPQHAGTMRVHEKKFIRGRGQLVSVDHVPSPEHDVDAYPLLLITGRVLQHYNVGTMTRRTPHTELVTKDWLEISPEDAARSGISDQARVRVESRYGSVELTAKISARVAPGTLFLSFHFPESHTNVLTGPHVDPDSHCPEYKLTAVRLTA